MQVAARRALKASQLLSERGCTLGQLVVSRSNHRLLATSSDEGTSMDSLEFVRWHNGGGLFHKSARIDPTVHIETGAVVHPDSVLDADVHVGSGTIVGPSVSIGKSTKLGALQKEIVAIVIRGGGISRGQQKLFSRMDQYMYNVVLSNCTVGLSCIIHNGVCIGQDGFGFLVDEQGHVVKKPQVLHVRIGDHVEIGANTCIDRGSWRDTVIGDHTKIDNLVQIAHNVVIGKCCMLCGQVGIAGSVTMGDYVTLGGRVAVRDHVSVASKVRLAANSSVTKDIVESGDYGGFPAVPIHEWRRQSAKLRRFYKGDVS